MSDISTILDKGWKKGLLLGVFLGVITILVTQLSGVLNWVPAKFAQILSVALPVSALSIYLPVVIYGYIGLLMGWVYDNWSRITDSRLYSENKLVGISLMILFVLPVIGITGNQAGLWCAGCGYGSMEITVKTPGGALINNGEAYCFGRCFGESCCDLSVPHASTCTTSGYYSGMVYTRTGGYYDGKAVFTDVPAGENVNWECKCTANPQIYDSVGTLAIVPGQTFSLESTLNCGSACTPTPGIIEKRCYLGDVWSYNDCGVRIEKTLECGVNNCIEPSGAEATCGSGTTCNFDGVCDANEDPVTCPSDCVIASCHECSITELNTCVSEGVRCQNVWEPSISDYCRRKVNVAPDCVTTTTTTIPACITDCNWNGCSGDWRCEEVQPGCFRKRYDTTCQSTPTTTIPVDKCTTEGECIGDYMCKRTSAGNLDKLWDARCLTSSTTTTTIPQAVCGNNWCETGEEISCPQDCVQPAVCGNGFCESGKGETYQTCPQDCPAPTSNWVDENITYIVGGVVLLGAALILSGKGGGAVSAIKGG